MGVRHDLSFVWRRRLAGREVLRAVRDTAGTPLPGLRPRGRGGRQVLRGVRRAARGRPQAGPALATAAPSPRSYTPPHLAERIFAGRAALEGERKQVTVLFADVVGSTELIQDRDPEEAQRLLDGVVQIMMDAVHRYEGRSAA